MRFAVFLFYSVQFCGIRTPLTPPSSRTSTNGHLSTTAIFSAASDGQSIYIHSCFNLSKTPISLQWPLSSVPKVAVVERFKCMVVNICSDVLVNFGPHPRRGRGMGVVMKVLGGFFASSETVSSPDGYRRKIEDNSHTLIKKNYRKPF